MTNPLWEYWYFFFPNYFLAVVMYTLFGRVLLSFFLPPDSDNYIMRFFRLLTNWAVRPISVVTPSMVHPIILFLLTAVWILLLRFGYLVLLGALDLAPQIAAASPPQ